MTATYVDRDFVCIPDCKMPHMECDTRCFIKSAKPLPLKYGDNKDCPIRITSVFGSNYDFVEVKAQRLIERFGWRIHSRAKLYLVHLEITIYSVLLFYPVDGKEENYG